METTLFICSIIACVIGIATFVVGMNSRAKADGEVVNFRQAHDTVRSHSNPDKFYRYTADNRIHSYIARNNNSSAYHCIIQ